MPMMITRRVIIELSQQSYDIRHRFTEGIAAEQCVQYQGDLNYKAREDDYLDAWANGSVVIKDVILGPFKIAVAYYWSGHRNFQTRDDITHLKLFAM